MPDQPLNNDLGGPYLASRADNAGAQALEELLRRHGGAEEAAAGEAKPGAPAAPAAAPQAKGGGMLKNFAEVGPAMYAGAHDAVSNAYEGISKFGDYLSDKTGYYGVHVGKDGVHMETKAEYYGTDTDPVQAGLKATQAGEPTTLTGGIVKNVSQFLTGLALTKGMFPELPAAGAVAKYGMSALHGAVANFAAFDPHQQRLSNLIEQFPALSNPVTQFLAAKPGDSEAEGRFKNSLEGLGFGTATDAMVRGIRMLGAVKGATAATRGLADTPAAPKPGVDENAFRLLGDERQAPDAPILQPKSPVPGMHADELQGGTPKQVYINFARIDAPEDIERTIQELADAKKGEIGEAARGTQTFEQIKLNAGQQNAWNILKGRRVGDPLNAEQSVAARQLWGASAAKVNELAQAVNESPTEANLFAFRKMLATHNAIQAEVIGARTETARALASWRIPTGTPESRLLDITGRLQEMGGEDATRELAGRVTQLANSPDQEQAALTLSKLAERGAFARTRDAAIQAFSDGLLTGPMTQAKILASNVTTGLWRVGERAVASKVSSLMGTENGVQPGEAAAMWSGWIGGAKDGLAYAGKALRTGVTGAGIGMPHEPYPSNISAESLPWLGRAADYIGTALSLGRRGIAAQHDMALTMAYRGELNAQATRQAISEVNAGALSHDGVDERVAELLAHPTDSMVASAQDGAKYQAFLDEPGKVAQWLLQGRQTIPALRVIAPFIKIPARIMSYTFERTPLAPLMSEFRSKIAEGGASRDLALAQVGLGTMISSTAADMVLNGRLKGGGAGPKGVQQAEEREGEHRDSVKIGDNWYNINGVHPAGKLMLLAADVAENVTQGQTELHDPEDVGKIVAATTMAIGRTMLDNSYFQGIANLFATLHDANVKGEGSNALLSSAGGAVPSAVGAVARASDPYQREIYSMLDEFKSKIPGLSKTLPPRRDYWGEPVPSAHDPATALFSPVQFAKETHSPIDDEIIRQGFNLQMPDRHQTFGDRGNAVAIDMAHYPQAYSRLLELAGHEYKSPAWGVGLKDLLNQIVSGSHPLSAVYSLKSDGPDGGKEVMIRDLVSQYRDGAKRQLLQEFPALAQEVHDKAQAQQALKLNP